MLSMDVTWPLYGTRAVRSLTLTLTPTTHPNLIWQVPLTKEQCFDTRDALAKGLYSSLFSHVVTRLNECLAEGMPPLIDDRCVRLLPAPNVYRKHIGPPHSSRLPHGVCAPTCPHHCPIIVRRYVGLLDIFGFENFNRNGFEQICINFTNERLQALFMNALVKLQQEEYAREGITCAHIDFPDNEKQIQLIDHKTNGLFSRLDDECSVPKGTDEAYVEKLHKAFKENPLYETPKRASTRAPPPESRHTLFTLGLFTLWGPAH